MTATMSAPATAPPRRGSRPVPPPRTVTPSRRVERELAEGGLVVAGMDEVGRGCLAGPVSVGVVVSCLDRRAPSGLRDSKLLPPPRREALVAPIRRWAVACAVGHASPAEIDAIGIIAALRLAGHRALAALPLPPHVVLLDGNHDWLTPPEDLFSGFAAAPEPVLAVVPRVRTRIKADMTCTGVAAASILAKVERDGLMRAEHARDPRFDLAENKGYASPSHIAALAQHGPSALHRRSWSLPGVAGAEAGSGEAAAHATGMPAVPRVPRTQDSPSDGMMVL
nr:ribonuclease HII [Miniimonas arenae]